MVLGSHGTLGLDLCSCSPQPHERDALLAGSLNNTLHLSNEQERGDWPGDGPKPSEPYSHHKGHGRSKHPSGSNVSFSRDTEGGEEEPSKVRGGRQGAEATLAVRGLLPPYQSKKAQFEPVGSGRVLCSVLPVALAWSVG